MPTTHPSALARTAETAHAVGLALWLSAVVAGGLTAAAVFPLMRDLEPTLGAFSAYQGDHAPLAGGIIAARVFELADAVQLIAAGLVLLTGGCLIARGGSKLAPSSIVRWLAVLVALCALTYRMGVLDPSMDTDRQAYWAAARVGDTAEAEAARQRFAAAHPAATRLIAITAGSVLVALAAGVWSSQRREFKPK